MKIKQIATLVNNSLKEVLGETDLIAEDLTNVVDIGTTLFNSNSVDNFVKKLVDQVGKIIVVDRKYTGQAPKVLMDAWEYGAVLEKISFEFPVVAQDNKSWELTDGVDYSQDVFTAPKAEFKFYSNRVTFEIPMSIAEMQVKSAFQSATQLNAFISGIFSTIENTLTLEFDKLIMQVIANATALTLHDEYPKKNYDEKSGVKAINLLKLYNDKFSKALTATNCIYDSDFLRFAVAQMNLQVDKMKAYTKLYNIGKKSRFTPTDLLHVVVLSEFQKNIPQYLLSDTYHDGYLSLPKYETVPYWQGTGTDFSFDKVSSIHTNLDSSDKVNGEVKASGILAVMFDHDCLGVSNIHQRVRSHVNERAEFTNYWYKNEAGLFNDMNEQFVVFFVA